MQRPTIQNVRIRSTRDALQVFNGVAINRLPLITRRLDAEERRAIIPGNVYVWGERGANTEPTGLGMERWTDGMGWGPSRVRDEFLFYHQKESDLNDDGINPVTPWAQMMRRPSAGRTPSRPYALDPRSAPESERLIKQTYSVHVSLPADRTRGIIRKWHLTAYFSQNKLDELRTVDEIPGIGDVAVPEGWFKSARVGKARRDSRAQGNNPQSVEASSQSTTPPFYTYPLGSSPTSQSRSNGPPNQRSSPPSPSSHSSTSSIHNTPHPTGQLVPLEYLKNVSAPRRDPTDEQLLRRFSS
ncbi:cAMP-independent regulatory protein pac2 [Leucoagaricus sp. SymC.cos]|nr:cAMP-independent regulatory protein pac2 [Leucoagaricus sp. SymC.cos]